MWQGREGREARGAEEITQTLSTPRAELPFHVGFELGLERAWKTPTSGRIIMVSGRVIAVRGEETQSSAAQLQLAGVTDRVLMSSATVGLEGEKKFTFNQKRDTRMEPVPRQDRLGRARGKMERQKFQLLGQFCNSKTSPEVKPLNSFHFIPQTLVSPWNPLVLLSRGNWEEKTGKFST